MKWATFGSCLVGEKIDKFHIGLGHFEERCGKPFFLNFLQYQHTLQYFNTIHVTVT